MLLLLACCQGLVALLFLRLFFVFAVSVAASPSIRRGLLDALLKIGRNEGVLAYWKGFAPYFLRLGNHTAFTFLFLEQLKKLW